MLYAGRPAAFLAVGDSGDLLFCRKRDDVRGTDYVGHEKADFKKRTGGKPYICPIPAGEGPLARRKCRMEAEKARQGAEIGAVEKDDAEAGHTGEKAGENNG